MTKILYHEPGRKNKPQKFIPSGNMERKLRPPKRQDALKHMNFEVSKMSEG